MTNKNSENKIKFILISPADYIPLFNYTGKSNINTGSIFRLPDYLTLSHEQFLNSQKEKGIISDWKYI